MHDIGNLGDLNIFDDEPTNYEWQEWARIHFKDEYDREELKTALKSIIFDMAINPDKMIDEKEFREIATLLDNAHQALFSHTSFSWKENKEVF